MKKILAGVLASVSLLAMTTSAFAAENEKAVTKAGDISYEVSVSAPKVVLDLVMPAKITAALNPYGADIKLDTAATPTTTNAGIASVAYTIKNNSLDYGVFLDATATTTVNTADAKAWTVNKTAVTTTATAKGANMALVGAVDAAGIKTLADAATPTASAAATATAQGVLVLDSTVAANASTGVEAGQTKQKKFMYIPAATTAGTPQTAAMALIGRLATGDDVEYTEDDSIGVNLILKVSAAGKTFAGGPSAPTGPVFANASDVAMSPSGGSPAATLTDDDNGTFTFDPAVTTYNLTSNLDAGGGRIDLTVGTVTDVTITVTATGAISYNSTNNRITAGSTGTGKLEIKLVDDNDSTKTTTYTFNFTIT